MRLCACMQALLFAHQSWYHKQRRQDVFQKLLGIDVLQQGESASAPNRIGLGPLPSEGSSPNRRELEEGQTEGWAHHIPMAMVLFFLPGILCSVFALGCAITIMDRLRGFVGWLGEVVWQLVFGLSTPCSRPSEGGELSCLLNDQEICEYTKYRGMLFCMHKGIVLQKVVWGASL